MRRFILIIAIGFSCSSISHAKEQRSDAPNFGTIQKLIIRCFNDYDPKHMMNWGGILKSGTIKSKFEQSFPISPAERANGVSWKGDYSASAIAKFCEGKGNTLCAPDWQDEVMSFYVLVKNDEIYFRAGGAGDSSLGCEYSQK